jgi:hypothetical protein
MLDQLQDIFLRVWNDLVSRPSGPMSFRFLLQPAMAVFFALRDGFKDAHAGRSPYFWTILTDPLQRRERLRDGLKAMSRVIIIGLVMDAAYQILVLKAFYPLEAAIVALGLAFVPYLLLRGPANRVVRWWLNRGDPHIHAPKK